MPPRKPERKTSAATDDELSIRIDLASGGRIGPGKIAVLEAIAEAGSISGAGRALSMSYRRTWELVEDLNRSLGAPVVATSAGGSGGGGASLTAVGEALIVCYRRIEAESTMVAREHLATLKASALSKPISGTVARK